MKIAFIGSRGVPALYGGFETATEEIGRRLAERGHRVTVYCRPGNGDRSEVVYRGMDKIYVPCVKRKSLETLSHTAMALMHAALKSYDVLIIMNPANGPLCIIPWLRGTPFAVHVDGLDWERSRWPAFGKKFIRFGAWCCTKLAPAIIADSHGIEAFYKQTWGRDSVYATYGADVQEPKGTLRLREFGLEARGFLLVVARLEPENHTDLIIAAYESLDTDVPLIVVGDTNYESDYIIRLKRSESDQVRLLGSIYDDDLLETLLQNCLLYIHGHSVGGTNPVLLRAMAASCAILALDVPFNTEVIADTGRTFSHDAQHLENALQDALDHPDALEPLRDTARDRVSETYTWEGVTDTYEYLCDRLSRGDRPSG